MAQGVRAQLPSLKTRVSSPESMCWTVSSDPYTHHMCAHKINTEKERQMERGGQVWDAFPGKGPRNSVRHPIRPWSTSVTLALRTHFSRKAFANNPSGARCPAVRGNQ